MQQCIVVMIVQFGHYWGSIVNASIGTTVVALTVVRHSILLLLVVMEALRFLNFVCG
jgi:hypothetical protein